MWLWTTASLTLTIPSTQYLFPTVFFPSKIGHCCGWICWVSNLLINQIREQNNVGSARCTGTPSSSYMLMFDADFFPWHIQSANCTATSSVPPTFPPSKRTLSCFFFKTITLPTVSLCEHIGVKKENKATGVYLDVFQIHLCSRDFVITPAPLGFHSHVHASSDRSALPHCTLSDSSCSSLS